jgi:dTDP-4-dehydrorhamnose 3,5-epimerase
MSYPGTVRAWHRHSRGQVDYLFVVKGNVRVCVYDGSSGSPTKGQLQEFVLDGEKPQVVRIPGFYWHGTKCIGKGPSITLYMMTKLYDYKKPDEERMDWNDPSVIDPERGKPYDWSE